MRVRNLILLKLIAWLGVWLLRVLFMTLRVEWHLSDPVGNPYVEPPDDDDRRFGFCVWHDSLIASAFVRRPRNTVILTSRHADASILAFAANMLGMESVRGSSSRSGAEAARQMIAKTQGRHFTVTPDGPRGPRRKIKQGIVYIAAKTEHPIVPCAFGASRAWRISGKWTDMLIPKPFSKLYVVTGEPIVLPRRVRREQLEEYTAKTQQAMDDMEVAMQRIVNGEHLPVVDDADGRMAA
jgi:lysophospholipid acyltransferase (LPLAT)-like uncharacterized protein